MTYITIGSRVRAIEDPKYTLKGIPFYAAGDLGVVTEVDEQKGLCKVQFDIAACGNGHFWVPSDLLELGRESKVHTIRKAEPTKLVVDLTALSDEEHGPVKPPRKPRKLKTEGQRAGKVKTYKGVDTTPISTPVASTQIADNDDEDNVGNTRKPMWASKGLKAEVDRNRDLGRKHTKLVGKSIGPRTSRISQLINALELGEGLVFELMDNQNVKVIGQEITNLYMMAQLYGSKHTPQRKYTCQGYTCIAHRGALGNNIVYAIRVLRIK